MTKARKISEDVEGPLVDRIGLVYARVSSKRQEAEGSGLTSQEGRCKKQLDVMGIQYVKTFPDSYSGGGDFMKRPAMREMIEYIDDNPHKKFLIIFDDLSRFARDVFFHIKLRAEFRKRDVILKCLNYNFDASEEGQFAELIFAGKAELDRKQNRRQVIQKQKARLELGYWGFPSKRPYKMTKHKVHGKILVPVMPDADYLKEALEKFSTGEFPKKIDACKFLREKGYWKVQKPERYIDKFSELASNPLYAGYIEYSEWGAKRREGHHKALISTETFELNLKRLSRVGLSQRIRTTVSVDFPLRGLLRCAECDRALTAAWSKGRTKKYAYYFCQNTSCIKKGDHIAKAIIEEQFDKLLKSCIPNNEIMKLMPVLFDRVWKREVNMLTIKERQREKEICKKDEEIKEMTRQLFGISSELVRKECERQIEELMLEVETFKNRVHISKTDFSLSYRTALEKSLGMLKNPYRIWHSVSIQEKHTLFFFLFNEKLPYSKIEGYRTDKIQSTVRLFEEFVTTNTRDVEMPRIELGSENDHKYESSMHSSS